MITDFRPTTPDLHYGSSVYSTPRDLAEEMIYDWLTACGTQSAEDALIGGTDAALADEMIADEWTHEAVDRDLMVDVLEDIRRRRIAFAISEIRDDLDLTQTQLAERLGVSQPAVAQWESGSSLPSLAQVGALRRVAGEAGERLVRLL